MEKINTAPDDLEPATAVISAQSLPTAFVTQVGVEVLGSPMAPALRVTQMGLQALGPAVYPFTAGNSATPGGLTMGGSAICHVAFYHTASGGVSMGSSARAFPQFSWTMTGGIKVSGYCDTSTTQGSTTYSLNGAPSTPSSTYITHQVQIGGKADLQATYNTPVASGSSIGGAVIGGSADAHIAFFHTMSGGISIGGTANANPGLFYSMQGGIAVSGQVGVTQNFSYLGSGSIGIGGTPNLNAGYKYTGSGGAVVSGVGAAHVGFGIVSTGGITMGGQADVKFMLFYTMKGGITMGGSVPTPKFALEYTGAGGVSLSGASKVLWGNSYTMKGGISMGGQSGNGANLSVGYHYKPEFPHNRIFIYGKGKYGSDSFNYTMTGGINMGGLGKIDYCAIACDQTIAYYRDAEARTGCQIVLPNGKLDYICARPIPYLPEDSIRRTGGSSALVPSVTVCHQSLTTNTQATKKNCGQFIRK
jgi:hypothetical protein